MIWPTLVQRWRERRDKVEQDAHDLALFLGDHAYDEARTRARSCREKGDRAGDRHWSRAAALIAKQTGREVGIKAADRYVQRDYEAERQARLERAVTTHIRAIGESLALIANGRDTGAELHNVRAHVLNAVDLVRTNPAARARGGDLVASAERLAQDRSDAERCIKAGVYPAALEEAGQALQRFRTACLSRLPFCLRDCDADVMRHGDPARPEDAIGNQESALERKEAATKAYPPPGRSAFAGMA